MHGLVNEMTHTRDSTRLKCTPKDFTPCKWIGAETSKARLSDTLEKSGLLLLPDRFRLVTTVSLSKNA